MKVRSFITFAAAAGMALAPIAASQAQTAPAGYLVVRDGKVISVATDASLKVGDRVVTRSSTGAKIAFEGCTVDVPAASTMTISADSCSGAVKSLDMARASYGMTDASAMKGSTWLVGVLAMIAIISGATIAAKGNKRPTSP